MPKRSSEVDREREEVLRRFFALPEYERLQAFEEIREYLSEDLGAETDADRLCEAPS